LPARVVHDPLEGSADEAPANAHHQGTPSHTPADKLRHTMGYGLRLVGNPQVLHRRVQLCTQRPEGGGASCACRGECERHTHSKVVGSTLPGTGGHLPQQSFTTSTMVPMKQGCVWCDLCLSNHDEFRMRSFVNICTGICRRQRRAGKGGEEEIQCECGCSVQATHTLSKSLHIHDEGGGKGIPTILVMRLESHLGPQGMKMVL
jgi:hypothetical protein